MPRRIDTGVFDKIQSFDDYRKANEEFQRKRAIEQQDATIKRQAFDLEAQKFEDERRATQEALRSGRMTGNSFQAQLWNQMDAQGYTPQQRIEALTMKGIPLQDGGYATYSPPILVGAPGGVPSGMPLPNPAPVQTSELPASSGGSPFNAVLSELQGKPTGMSGQASDNAPVPNPPTPQQMANQAQYRFGGVDVLVQPGMRQADRIELQQQVNKQGDALSATVSKAENVNQMIDKAIEQTSGWSAGWGSKLAVLPATDARNLDATLDTIKANLSFDELNQMRQNSPTGGALGNVTERELAFLQSVTASLDQAQSPEQLRQNLAVIKQHVAGMRGRLEDAYARDLAQFGPQAMAGISISGQMAAAPQNVQHGNGGAGIVRWEDLP